LMAGLCNSVVQSPVLLSKKLRREVD
jgi:hypothetical protein